MFRGGFFPADKVYCCAISAIDIALWDIKGKALNMPTYKLLGGPVRDKVGCYPHAQGRTNAELVENSVRVVEEGWKFVRWGQPETGGTFEYQGSEGQLEPVVSMRIAEQQMAMVREAVGPDIQLCFDVHTRLDTAHVVAMCKTLEPYRPFFIEDPIRSENPGSYRKLAHHINLPIAAGEQWPSKWAFREVIEEELIDYARIDVCNVGGLTEAMKVAHWCETHYIDLAPHNPLGPVSAAACVAMCMASTNVGVQELPKAPGTLDARLFPAQIDFDDGYAIAPDRPGLGVEIDMEAAESAATRPTGFAPVPAVTTSGPKNARGTAWTGSTGWAASASPTRTPGREAASGSSGPGTSRCGSRWRAPENRTRPSRRWTGTSRSSRSAASENRQRRRT